MSQENTDVKSVDTFDLERYLGRWFEVGRLPLKWEDTHATCITAHYERQEDGTLAVDNRCFDDEGTPTQSVGRAKPVRGAVGQLKVSFVPPFLRWIPFTEGDYWVLKVDADYRVALVGTPNRENLWLLARDHQLDLTATEEFLAHARSQGFDLSRWIIPFQDGRVVTDQLLKAQS